MRDKTIKKHLNQPQRWFFCLHHTIYYMIESKETLGLRLTISRAMLQVHLNDLLKSGHLKDILLWFADNPKTFKDYEC